jgi:hypothetical protein
MHVFSSYCKESAMPHQYLASKVTKSLIKNFRQTVELMSSLSLLVIAVKT